MNKASGHSVALLIFTRTAEAEAKHKVLIPRHGIGVNQKIARTLIQQTVCMASNTLAPVFMIDETQQVGNTFGEKFANSFKKLFDQGFDNVIAIGNDCPDLTPEVINQSIRELYKKEWVVGPSKDEGMFLIGMRKECFNFVEFSTLPWQKKGLIGEFIAAVQKNNKRIHLLTTLIDVDNYKDVLEFLQQGKKTTKIYQLLWELVTVESKKNPEKYTYYYTPRTTFVPILRGPPQ